MYVWQGTQSIVASAYGRKSFAQNQDRDVKMSIIETLWGAKIYIFITKFSATGAGSRE